MTPQPIDQKEIIGDGGKPKAGGLTCANVTCTETVASLEQLLDKAAVKFSRMERHYRQQRDSLASKNEQLSLEKGEMREKLQATEAVVVQHLQLKDSFGELEAPPSVIQQQLHNEREKASKLQAQVDELTTSCMAYKEAARTSERRQSELASELKQMEERSGGMEKFINDYCHATENSFRLSAEDIRDSSHAMHDHFRRMEVEANRIPSRLRGRLDNNLEFRDKTARQHGWIFKDGRLTKLWADAVGRSDGNLPDRSRDPRLQQREARFSTAKGSLHPNDTTGKANNNDDNLKNKSPKANQQAGHVTHHSSDNPTNGNGGKRRRRNTGAADSDRSLPPNTSRGPRQQP